MSSVDETPKATAYAARPWPMLVVAIVAFLACLHQIGGSPPNPCCDSVEYLTYGRTVAQTGQYALTAAGPHADPDPGREPLYPVLIALVMRLDPVLAENADACIGKATDPRCPMIYRSLLWTNALLVAVAAALAYFTARMLGAGTTAAWVAGAYMALNFQLMKESKYVVSDYLALALAAVLMAVLVEAVNRPRSPWRWLAVGIVLGLLILTKAIYELYALALIGALLVALVRHRDRVFVRAVLAVVAALVILVGGWMARNWVEFGRATVTDSRGGMVLSTREIFDHMSAGEYAASFLWWTRGPGADLARKLFPERDWHRQDSHAPDGFYQQGVDTLYQARVQRLMDERHLDRPAAEAATSGMIVGEMLREFPMYVATMIPVTYRGLWFDEFIVLGFPALVWLLIRAARRRDWVWLAGLSPAVFSLLVYPATSLNITRFQIPAGPGLALAGGVAVAALVDRARTARNRMPPVS